MKVQRLKGEIVNNSFYGQKMPPSALKIWSSYKETIVYQNLRPSLNSEDFMNKA